MAPAATTYACWSPGRMPSKWSKRCTAICSADGLLGGGGVFARGIGVIRLLLILVQLQSIVGDGAKQRIDALHIPQQTEMQRAGFQALHILLMQTIHMGVSIAAVGDAKSMLSPAQTARAGDIAGQEHRQAKPQVGH